MEELKSTVWSDGSEEDELIRELLDDESPFFVLVPHQQNTNHSKQSTTIESPMNRVGSTVYYGPTIEDIENALSNHHFQEISEARISMLEKGLGKDDNKYTLKAKSFGNGMVDDGYKWRKYGQKSIKNSPNPRSYYRCTNPRCNARKQVEKSNDDPETLIITYEGLHLHFADPYFPINQPHNDNPTTKKFKKTVSQAHEAPKVQLQDTAGGPESFGTGPLMSSFGDCQQESAQEELGPKGLLEDLVPVPTMTIRNPSDNLFSSNSSSFSSHMSPPTSPASLSCSPHQSPTFF